MCTESVCVACFFFRALIAAALLPRASGTAGRSHKVTVTRGLSYADRRRRTGYTRAFMRKVFNKTLNLLNCH
jgi:hypothetical protein